MYKLILAVLIGMILGAVITAYSLHDVYQQGRIQGAEFVYKTLVIN